VLIGQLVHMLGRQAGVGKHADLVGDVVLQGVQGCGGRSEGGEDWEWSGME